MSLSIQKLIKATCFIIAFTAFATITVIAIIRDYQVNDLNAQLARSDQKLSEQKLEQKTIDYRTFQLIIDSRDYTSILEDSLDMVTMDSVISILRKQLHDSARLAASQATNLEKTSKK